MSPSGSRRLRSCALSFSLCLLLPFAARASNLHCGDVLGPGHWLLETDLVCDSNVVQAGLTLTNDAHLDMGGHFITFLVGGTGTGLAFTGTRSKASHGTLKGMSIGAKIDGTDNRLSRLEFTQNNFGLFLQGASKNDVSDCNFHGNFDVGVQLFSSSGNSFRDLLVEDTFGTALQGGFWLQGSDRNAIVHSTVLRNACTGIMLIDSSHNLLALNSVRDSKCFGTNPAINLALVGASVGNVITANQLSATAPGSGTSDGLNIGCKGGCAFQGPTTGASGNFVILDKANDNARYGFAQGPGNPGNVFLLDQATGNGVANFAIDP